MADKSISDAVRELEELRDEGFLSEEQFRREVRELLERNEELPSGAGGSVSGSSKAGLGDMVRHADPVPKPDDAPWELDDTPEIVGTVEEDAQSETPVAPSFESMPPVPPKEPGRVIVTGKTPWDDKGSSRVSLASTRREDEEKDEMRPVHGSAHKPLNPIQREELARMAERTNKVINKQKREDVAFILSFILPGLGHLYYGDIATGMALALIGGAAWVTFVLTLEFWVFYILAPLCLLSGALAHKAVKQRNRYTDLRSRADQRRRPSESSLNVEKSIRQAGAAPPSDKR